MAKVKLPQVERPTISQNRDNFSTPNYAVDLLMPYLNINENYWECAAGMGQIVRRMTKLQYNIYGSDVERNFLGDLQNLSHVHGIVTNPPFSLKRKFYYKCLDYLAIYKRLKIALLIPADYSQWIIEALQCGWKKIIPTRRISFITPNIVQRVNDGEGTEYINVYDIPNETLSKYSSSQFHSMWLTYNLPLAQTETFVELPLSETKLNII